MDINCDLGESYGNWRMGDDAAMLPLISSANVACGFHASDPVTLVRTVRLVHEHGVAVGAHPGLPDKLGFGRRRMAISAEEAYADVLYQVGAVQAAARAAGTTVSHVKPHGALMSMLGDEQELADAFVAAVADGCDGVPIYFTAPLEGAALPGAAARRGVPVVAELYPDLSYDAAGRVVIERSKHATDVVAAAAQVGACLDRGEVATIEGGTIALTAQSICVHGDGPNAVAVLGAVRAALAERGVTVGRGALPGEATA